MSRKICRYAHSECCRRVGSCALTHDTSEVLDCIILKRDATFGCWRIDEGRQTCPCRLKHRRLLSRTRGCTGCLPTPEHICSRYQCGSSAPSAIRTDLGTSRLMTDGRFRITPTVQRCWSFLGCHARAQRPGYTIGGHALIRRTRRLTREQTFLFCRFNFGHSCLGRICRL
jgi:hypothetical protein